eukprot:559195-Rhodomonas_salina.3
MRGLNEIRMVGGLQWRVCIALLSVLLVPLKCELSSRLPDPESSWPQAGSHTMFALPLRGGSSLRPGTVDYSKWDRLGQDDKTEDDAEGAQLGAPVAPRITKLQEARANVRALARSAQIEVMQQLQRFQAELDAIWANFAGLAEDVEVSSGDPPLAIVLKVRLLRNCAECQS